jgi:hypothetical protein
LEEVTLSLNKEQATLVITRGALTAELLRDGMIASLLAKSNDHEPTGRFAERVSEILNLQAPEERESSNWPPENCYYLTRALGIVVKVSASDDSQYTEFDFYISIKPEPFLVEREHWISDVSDLVARKLALAGYIILRLLDHSETSDAVEYTRQDNETVCTRTLVGRRA